MRRFIVPLVGLLFILPALACGSTTGSGGGNATRAPLPQGDTASVKNWDVTLVSVERPGKTLVWSQFGNQSAAAGEWLVVAVTMRNTGKENFGVNTHDFELQGGATYKVSSDIGALSYSEFKGGQRIGGQVPPGVDVTYHIPYDVAPGATGLVLVFKQDTQPRFTLP